MAGSMKYPPWHLYSGREYIPSHQTDIRKTFQRAIELQSKVRPIRKEKKA